MNDEFKKYMHVNGLEDYLELQDLDLIFMQQSSFYKKHLELCLNIAKKAHDNQLRRCGEEYINHPVRVANMLDNPFHKCVALLHDVIEDTNFGISELIIAGVDKNIVSSVLVLTHFKPLHYDEYIQGICKSRWLVNVKLADIVDNLCGKPTEKQKTKYAKAVKILLNS